MVGLPYGRGYEKSVSFYQSYSGRLCGKRPQAARVFVFAYYQHCRDGRLFYGAWYLVTNMESITAGAGFGGLVLSWVGIAICAIAGFLFFLQGLVAQVVTLITGLIGLGKAGERAANAGAAAVALLSIAALVAAGILLFA